MTKRSRALGKRGDDFLRHPVAEELLLGIFAHVHEGQHGYGWLVRQRVFSSCSDGRNPDRGWA